MRRRGLTAPEAGELPSQVRVARRIIRSVVVVALSATLVVGTASVSLAATPAAGALAAGTIRAADDGASQPTEESSDGGQGSTDQSSSASPGESAPPDGSSGSTDPSSTVVAADPPAESPTSSTSPTSGQADASDPANDPSDPNSTGDSGGSSAGTGSTAGGSTSSPDGSGGGSQSPTSSPSPTGTTGTAGTTTSASTSAITTSPGTRAPGRTGTGTGPTSTPTTILDRTLTPPVTTSGAPGGSGSSVANPAIPGSGGVPNFVGTVTDAPTLGPFRNSFSAASVGTVTATCPTVDTAQTASDPAHPVLPAGVYANVHLTDAQAQTAQLIISVGKGLKITDRGVRIALAVALQESSLQPWVVSGPYAGLFQQLPDPTTGLYLDYDRYDATGATRMFYDRLLALVPGYQTDPRPDWQIGEQIQQTGQGELFDTRAAVAAALTSQFFAEVPAYDFDPPSAVPASSTVSGSADCAGGAGSSIGLGGFNPGDIISDAVFYDATAMNVDQVRAFIQAQGASCTDRWCLRNLRVTTTSQPADQYCDAYAGAADEDAASVITKVALACHVNPQVMLVTLQKESALLTRTDASAATYAAAWGWHCPDSGPGGSASCDPRYAGFFAQAYGMAKQWARYKVDPDKYHYRAGQTAEVLWNVAQSGCGGSMVHIVNTATASLYNYTPYQPNAAALAGYPGVGDSCSSYGNRNFYYLFVDYFGGTGGGSPILVDGVSVTIPASRYVPAGLVGKTVTAPNAAVARGIAAGLAVLGTPYVWGGGTAGGPADSGCARGGGSENSCRGLVGFDCSGLTAYVLAQAGFTIPDNSAGQRASGTSVPWAQAMPGDIIGYPGHVAIYLGQIGGTGYLLESPTVGSFVHITAVYSTGGMTADSVLHRYWA